MNLQERINLLSQLSEYMLSDDDQWQQAKEKAGRLNSWFTPEFVELSAKNIALQYLQKDALTKWTVHYNIPENNPSPKTIGIVMAGNIPLVGFHDMLCVFITGHKAVIKASSKDDVLIKHLSSTLASWNSEVNDIITFSEMAKGCDAYIATGSNNSAGYFEYYFSKYPHIIRRNRTSVAILTGKETNEELNQLADDVYLYFGLGCRNVTKLYLPETYDFRPLLDAFKKYDYLADLHKYKNNYDFNLAVLLLNKKAYMGNESLLLTEEKSLFSPIGQLNYEFYNHIDDVSSSLKGNDQVQCIVGKKFIPFGKAQSPSLYDYADGIDTMRFLMRL
jgi:hypothetical protein